MRHPLKGEKCTYSDWLHATWKQRWPAIWSAFLLALGNFGYASAGSQLGFAIGYALSRGTLLVSGSDENDGTALISIYYGQNGDQWAWKSYDDKETALKDAKLLVNIVDDEEVDVNQLKRFGFELM